MKKITLSLLGCLFTHFFMLAQAPANDDLANATPLTMDAVCSGDAYTNVGATAQTGEPVGSCFNSSSSIESSVWFSFVAPASGNVSISTDIAPGALGDSEIAVYAAPTTSGDPSTLPAELDCDQDGGDIVGSGWMSYLELFGLTVGDTYYIQVDGYGGDTGAFCIEVKQILCADPSALTVASVTATSADLGWTENGAGTTWDVHVVPAGDPAPDATTTPSDAGVTANPYTISGLNANTAYDFYVRTDCGNGNLSAWIGPYAFNTLCNAVAAPWFDDLETQPDDTSFTGFNCWTAMATTGYAWSVEANGSSNSSLTGPDNPYSGDAYFYIEASSGGTGDVAELYSPMIDITALTTPTLKFFYHMYGADMGELHVDVHDGTAWVDDVHTIIGEQQTAGSDPWLNVFVDLSTYTGTIQIRFRAISAGTYEGDISLDDISVIELPTCFAPNVLTATNILDTSADLGWTDANTPAATTWDVHVVPAGDPSPDATTTPSNPGVTTNPYNVTGLAPITYYEFYVRSDCGGGDFSTWTGPFAFNTSCPASFSPYYVQDFTTAVAPDCWAEAGSGDPTTGPSGTTGSWLQDEYLNITGSLNQAAGINLYSSSKDEWLISPEFDLSGGTYELAYIAAVTDNGNSNPPEDAGMGSDDEVQVLITTDGGTTWANLKTYNQAAFPSHTGDLETINLSTYTGTVGFAFWATEGTSNDPEDYDFFIDNFEVRLVSTCPQPSDLTATAIMDTHADLGWTENGTAGTWDVHVVLAGDPMPDATTTPSNAGVAANPFNVTGLTAETDYDFYVRADCGTGNLSYWSGPYEFRTPCAPMLAPWLDDVEAHSSDTSLDESNCWTTASVSAYDWNIDSFGSTPTGSTGPSGAFSGDYYFYTEGSSGAAGDVAELFTPYIDLSALTTPALKFYYHMYGADMGELHVDIFDGSTWINDLFVVIGEQQTADTDPWLREIIDLSTYTGVVQIRFRAISAGTTLGDIALDDIEFLELPNCLSPSGLTVNNIMATTADLGWTDTNTPAGALWDVHVVPAGDPAPTGSTTLSDPGVTANPYTVTGLTGNTDYEFYVRTDCGGGTTSGWAGPFAFKTACVALTAPWFDDLETQPEDTSFTNNNCWTATATTVYDWNVEANGSANSSGTGPDNPYSGDAYFYIEASSSSAGDIAELYSPMIDVSALTAPALEFYYHMFGGNMGELHVDVHDGTAWVNDVHTIIGEQQTAGSDPWLSALVDLSTYTGTIQIRFRAISAGTYEGDISLDDISVIEMPTCLVPTSLTAAAITANSADLSWTDTNTPVGTLWDVHVVPAGDPAPTGSTTPSDPGVTANPYTVTGLTSNTNYDFYVRTDCGGGTTSGWAGPFAFKTLCGVTVAPWFDDLEVQVDDASFTGFNCWTATATTAYDWNVEANGSGNSTGTGPDNPYSGNAYFYIEASSGSVGDVAELYSPMIDVSALTTPALKFYYHMYGSVMGDLHVDIHDGTAWVNDVHTILGQQQTASSDPWLSALVDLSTYTGTIQIRFRAISAGIFEGDISLDDISVIEMPTCLQPTALTVSGLTPTSADLGWTDANTPAATTWDVHVVPAGDPAPDATTTLSDPGVTTNPYTKTGLTANTNYEFYVRTDCGAGDMSFWSGPYPFYTGYCISDPTSNDGNGIANIEIDNTVAITNYPGTDVTYLDFTATPVDMPQTVTVDVSITYETGWTYDTNIWIDFNNDLVFDTATELVYSGMSTNNNPTTLVASFLVPATAPLGTYGMRIGTADSGQSPPDPCYNGSYGVTADFVVNVVGPPCYDPSNIIVDSILQTSVDVSWTENGQATEWEIEYGPVGFAQGTGTIISDTNGTLGETISGLTAATVYDVYVRALCANTGDMSGWVGPMSFTTACAALTTFPYTESFEDTSQYRVCWKMEYVSGEEDWVFAGSNQNGTISPNTGSMMAHFATTNPTGDVTKLVSPALDLSSVTNPQLEFYYANVSWLGDIDELRVYYKASFTDVWTQIGVDYTTENTAWTKVTLDLPNKSSSYYIAFEGTSNYGRGLDLDDVWIGEGAITCADPINLMVTSITSTSAELSWDPVGNAVNGYEWYVFGTGVDPNTGTPVATGITAAGTTMATATGLAPETGYDFYVMADCGANDGTSNLAGPKFFETPLGISNQELQGFSYYPNPVSHQLSLEANSDIEQVIIYDLLGREVLKLAPNSPSPVVDFADFQSGTYLMKVNIGNSTGVYRIIKD